MPRSLARFLVIVSLAAAANTAPRAAAAQAATVPSGRITGRVIDAKSGDAIGDAGVQIVGRGTGAATRADGRFFLPEIPAGTVTIQVRRIGYQPKTVTGIMLVGGQTLEQNIALTQAAAQLQALVVTAAAERGAVGAALDQQRRAPGIVTAITAAQIERSPDSDAAQAMQRVSGVTVQDGKYVFVRGLGERYTTTTLNGVRIPSPEPERKVVPLDLFPSSLLESVTTAKTFTPDLPGDFSGAQVDLRTREFPAGRVLAYSTTIGYNAAATGGTVPAAPRLGTEWLALAGGGRSIPSALGNGSIPASATQADINRIVGSFRNAWTPIPGSSIPNLSGSATIGGEGEMGPQRIGYVGSLSYANTQEVRAGEHRAKSNYITSSNSSVPFDAFTGSSGRSGVLFGGLVNLSSWFGDHTKIALNNSYNRSADNEAQRDEGVLNTDDLGPARRMTLSYIERSVRSSQLRLDHAIGTRHQLDGSFTSSGVTRSEPDRSDIVYTREALPSGELLPYAWLSSRPDAARRSFSDLTENALAGDANYKLSLASGENEWSVKAGGAYRTTRRDASALPYDILSNALTHAQRELAPEQIFDGRFARASDPYFRIIDQSTGGRYTADESIAGSYAMAELPRLFGRLRIIGGARVERWKLDVNTESVDPTVGRVRARRNNTDVLPSLIVNVRLTEAQTLRISASRTVSRPEYRELVPTETTPAIIGEVRTVGNDSVRRALIRNYDVKWEWYPAAGEVLSLGAFAKDFIDPIETVELSTSGAEKRTYQNARGANNYGVELEVRKGLGSFARSLSPLSVFGNATVMQSQIRLTPGSASQNRERPMVGQAPYVVNGGLAYAAAEGRATATVLYNVVGRRVWAAGTNPRPDSYELARSSMDVTLQLPLFRAFSAKIDGKNLLDAPVIVRQGTVDRLRYTTGRVLSLGVSWKP
ncbi:MAG: TonB-dependent receptor [Gemmatimonadaceae bacterium]